VSIITALNAHKDEINHLGSLYFAAEMNQSLHHFFSQDSVPSKESKERKKSHKGSYKHSIKHGPLPVGAQNILWGQSPCVNTNLIPGKLSLCISMPIMIHVNSATGRVPGSATYTKLRVGQSDSLKLSSSLHGSRNHKLLQSQGIKIIIYLHCMEVGMKVVE